VRKTVVGTAERPRLNVFRSLSHIYAQLINDKTGTTLVSASTLDKEVGAGVEYGGNIEAAKAVGTAIAKRALEKGINKVVFDRGGYIYHGRVAALAEAAREAGLEF
jgi:large subunit ribosomal protein L18